MTTRTLPGLRVVKAAEVEIFSSQKPRTSRHFGDEYDEYDSDILLDSISESDHDEVEAGTPLGHQDNLEDSICSSPLPFKIRTADEFTSFLSRQHTTNLSCSSSFDDSDAERYEDKQHDHVEKSQFVAQANEKPSPTLSPTAYKFRSKPANTRLSSPPKEQSARSDRSNTSGVTTTATCTRKVIKRTTKVSAGRGAAKRERVKISRPPKVWKVTNAETESKFKKESSVKFKKQSSVKTKAKSRRRPKKNGTARVYDRCVPPRMNAPTVITDVPPSKNGVRVTWTSTAPNNGPPPNVYELQQRRSSDGIWKTVSAELPDTHCSIANAIPGERYSFRVRAQNRYGWSRRWSASKTSVLTRTKETGRRQDDAGLLTDSLFIRTKHARAQTIRRRAEQLRQNRSANASARMTAHSGPPHRSL